MFPKLPRCLIGLGVFSFVIMSLFSVGSSAGTAGQEFLSGGRSYERSMAIHKRFYQPHWNHPAPTGIISSGGQNCGGTCNLILSVFPVESCHIPPTTIEIEISTHPSLLPYSMSVTAPDGELVYVNTNGQGFETFQAPTLGSYTVTITNASGCTVVCSFNLSPCVTLTQEQWGDSNSSIQDQGVPQVIDELLATGPLSVGIPGRSLTFPLSSSSTCLIQRLPITVLETTTSGHAKGKLVIEPLPFSGDAIVDPISCDISPRAERLFLNALLGQQVALSLNGSYAVIKHGGLDGSLLSATLCNVMVTQTIGRDGLLGTEDDQIKTVRIPPSVTKALARLDLPANVAGLIELADRALGGDSNLGGASLKDIYNAVESINGAFDGDGGFVIKCKRDDPNQRIQ